MTEYRVMQVTDGKLHYAYTYKDISRHYSTVTYYSEHDAKEAVKRFKRNREILLEHSLLAKHKDYFMYAFEPPVFVIQSRDVTEWM